MAYLNCGNILQAGISAYRDHASCVRPRFDLFRTFSVNAEHCLGYLESTTDENIMPFPT